MCVYVYTIIVYILYYLRYCYYSALPRKGKPRLRGGAQPGVSSESILYYTILYYTILCYTILYYAILRTLLY